MNKLKRLANRYDFEDAEGFFNYIIESHINGQRKQFTQLMTEFIQSSSFLKQEFQMCIINSCNSFGLERTIKVIKCYGTFEFGNISDTTIINAFYDNSISNLDEVKEILINN